jgi:hypothetical protein
MKQPEDTYTLDMFEGNCPLAEAVEFYWGERCLDYEPTCHVCVAWAQYDKIKNLTNVREGAA